MAGQRLSESASLAHTRVSCKPATLRSDLADDASGLSLLVDHISELQHPRSQTSQSHLPILLSRRHQAALVCTIHQQVIGRMCHSAFHSDLSWQFIGNEI